MSDITLIAALQMLQERGVKPLKSLELLLLAVEARTYEELSDNGFDRSHVVRFHKRHPDLLDVREITGSAGERSVGRPKQVATKPAIKSLLRASRIDGSSDG